MAPKKRPAAKGGKIVRWSDDEIARLTSLVEQRSTLAAALREFADETDRSVATVTKKWYALQNAGSPAVASDSAGDGRINLRMMGTDALVSLHGDVRSEIDRRIAELQKAAK